MEGKNNNVCDDLIFKKLFHSLGEQVFRFLLLKYQNTTIAREGMQEAFIALWKNCKDVSESKAKNYVFTVGRNRAIDIIRKDKKHLSIVKEDFIYDDEQDDVADESKSFKMKQILSKMTDASKEAFLMNRVQGLKYVEIAKELNISVKAVEKRMSIALQLIRNELKK